MNRGTNSKHGQLEAASNASFGSDLNVTGPAVFGELGEKPAYDEPQVGRASSLASKPHGPWDAFLPKCPAPGLGVHTWVYCCCRILAEYEVPVESWQTIIAPRATRRLQRAEIANAARSLGYQLSRETGAWTGEGIAPRPNFSKWPVINAVQRQKVLCESPCGVADLRAQSPFKLTEERQTDVILSHLFRPDDLLYLAKSTHAGTTKTLRDWGQNLHRLQFMVPNPMRALYGKTQAGRVSARALENAGERIYQVVEFDTGTFDEHATLISHLGSYARLVLAVHSGGKSLHGWFAVSGNPEEKVREFFEYAVSLGADRATWTKCQLVRLPDGTRPQDKRQAVVFFDPSIIKP